MVCQTTVSMAIDGSLFSSREDYHTPGVNHVRERLAQWWWQSLVYSNTSDCFGKGNYGNNAMAAVNQQIPLAGLGIGVSGSNIGLDSLGAVARKAEWHEPMYAVLTTRRW